MKLFLRALCCGVVICCILSLTGFSTACGQIEDKVLRLHILANSDSEEDQALKLKVRDGLTVYMDQLFAGCTTKEQAQQVAKKNLSSIRQEAQRIAEENGSHQSVSVSLTNMAFDTRVYEDFTLPAGHYDALRVVLGEGQGHNWWCVLYPAVCVPSAEKKIGSVLNENETEIVTDSDKYIVRFKIVEWFTQLGEMFH